MDGLNEFLIKFVEFKELLIQNNFFDANYFSELISETQSNEIERQLKRIVQSIESRDQKEIEKFAFVVRNSQLFSEELMGPIEETDGTVSNGISFLVNRFKDLLSSPKACGQQIVVKKAKKVMKNKDNYPMISNTRGFVVIIDNQDFSGSTPVLPFRYGSRADADRLSDVFTQLFFEPLRYTNKTGPQMQILLESISKDTELSAHDALAVIILSHGNRDGIYGIDGNIVAFNKIVEYFNNENCHLLRNKPKMFFLSACRGGRIDCGVKNDSYFPHIKSLGKPKITLLPQTLPTWSDIFVYYSTLEGYASFRNTGTGSWFGYELAHCLAEFAHTEHLNDLVTIKVSEKLLERDFGINGSSALQAIESQTKGPVKKVFFNPGLTTN